MLGGDYEARVLEPSPPAVSEDPWTDDPVEPGEVPEGRDLVSPVHNRGDLTWDEIASQDPDLAPWCAERWLGAWKRLEPLPAAFAETRDALHKVAEAVVSPARLPRGEISLRYTRGGFGTPFFEEDGQDCQVRVADGELDSPARQGGDHRAAAARGRCRRPSALGDFYGFGCSVLEQLRADEVDGDPSKVVLWPEHFDIALELGSRPRAGGRRLGASPGDESHSEPYLYVTPWTADLASGELWKARASRGPSSGTPSCSRPRTSGGLPSTSSATGTAPCRRASRDEPAPGEAGERTRTADPFITNEVLYQLSYAGTSCARRL